LLYQSRPYGVALLLAGCDKTGPHLMHSDPSGTFSEYKAKAIGSGSDSAQTALQESFNADMTFEEAETLALKTLKEVMEEKITSENIEVSSVKMGAKFHLYNTEELQAVIEKL
jgi:20S proteasome subunit alpha 5